VADVPVAFSPDSRHWAAIARISGREALVLDGQTGELYDQISDIGRKTESQALAAGTPAPLIAFDGNAGLHYIVQRGSEVTLVEERLS
jgi:hypothetical protein